MPSSASSDIVELRQLLAERFPGARTTPSRSPAAESGNIPTGIAALDRLLGGGLPVGEMTELVGALPGSGSAQVVGALLHQSAARGQSTVLVDGADSLDIEAFQPEVAQRFLWIRCRATDEALKATDIVLRDRNLPLVILDLKLNPAAQLHRISSSIWYRLGRLQESHRTTVLVVTGAPLVSGVACRVKVEGNLGIDAFGKSLGEIGAMLRFTLLRSIAVWRQQDQALAG